MPDLLFSCKQKHTCYPIIQCTTVWPSKIAVDQSCFQTKTFQDTIKKKKANENTMEAKTFCSRLHTMLSASYVSELTLIEVQDLLFTFKMQRWALFFYCKGMHFSPEKLFCYVPNLQFKVQVNAKQERHTALNNVMRQTAFASMLWTLYFFQLLLRIQFFKAISFAIIIGYVLALHLGAPTTKVIRG